MSDRWYYQLLMEEFGPVSQESIQELLHCGTLAEGDLVRSEAGGDWILISAMKESLQASDSSESMLEEIQDLSELNFSFETSGSAPSCASRSVNAPVSSPRSTTRPVPKPSQSTRESSVAVRTVAPVRKRTTESVAANTATASSSQQKPVVANGKRKRVTSDKDTVKVSRSKRISSNGGAVDGELPEDVFNDVFQKQDTPSQSSVSATASMATSPTSAGMAGSAASRGAIGTPSSVSSNAGYSTGASLSPAPVSALYSAAPSMPTVPPGKAYTPPRKKSVSVSEPMDMKKAGTAVGAIAAIVGVLATSVFGLPFGGGPIEVPFDAKGSAIPLSYIMRDFDAVVQNPNEEAWDECIYNSKPQLTSILAATQDATSDAPDAIACRAAAKALMQIAESKPDNEEVFNQCKLEFEKQIALVQ